MKSQILERPLFKKDIEEDEVENVGIMQGFMDEMEAEDENEMEDDDDETAKMMDRKPNSPEILMNNLRGDMRSVDARFEELADLVGYNAASETPEEVLALLQPVLAQQQAMPQGGIPAALPPEMGAMAPNMGMMPPPAMPPEAAMGGIGALPADQGPAPVAMAQGGYVQSFQEGSDEDGVTPVGGSSSYPMGTFSPAMIEQARTEIARSLARQPIPVPDLLTQVESRTPTYEKLLGVDKNLSQAQILFELGQRAFNYGANVDDQGRPLRGSQMARLAGATRTLPGAMGTIIAQTEQQKRAVRSAALQAAEKDVQNIREQNIKTEATKQKLYGDILKSGTAGSKTFGSSEHGLAMSFLSRWAPDYASGTLSPDMDRQFEAAVSILSTPIQYQDPESGRLMTRLPSIPEFAKKALAIRGGAAPVKPSTTPVLGAPSPTGKVYKEGDLSYLEGKDLGPVIDTGEYTLAPEGKEGKPAPKEPKMSLWNSASAFTGAIAAGKSAISSIPSLGGEFPEVAKARSYVHSTINQIVGELGTTARFGNTEREQIKKELGLTESVFQDPILYMNRLLGLEQTLLEQRRIAQDVVDDKENTSLAQRNEAKNVVKGMDKSLALLNIPRVSTVEQARTYPVGSWIVFNGKVVQVQKKRAPVVPPGMENVYNP